jgi:hypothetical protein
LRLADGDAFAGLALLVRGECRLASEFDAFGFGVGRAASPFEVTQQRFPHLIASRGSLCLGRDCRRNRTRADHVEQRGFESTRNPPNAMQRGSPLSSRPRWQE